MLQFWVGSLLMYFICKIINVHLLTEAELDIEDRVAILENPKGGNMLSYYKIFN
jgi:hypothetical protein